MKRFENSIELQEEIDVVRARRQGRDMARDLGFRSTDQTRLATAISELARNVLNFAGSGICLITGEWEESNRSIRVVVEDHGPGISDVHLAMEDGFSTGKGLGAGLPGTRRLVDEFDIQSQPGHTRVSIMMRRKLG